MFAGAIRNVEDVILSERNVLAFEGEDLFNVDRHLLPLLARGGLP